MKGSMDTVNCITDAIGPLLYGLKDPKIKTATNDFFLKDVNAYVADLVNISQRLNDSAQVDSDIKESFFKSTDSVLNKAQTLEKKLDSGIAIKKAKQAYRTIISPWIYQGKIVERAFAKPRGYPGDYFTLEQIYNNKPESTGIGCYSDLYFLANEYAAAVRKRKDTMKEILSDFISSSSLSRINILNIACGSCREIKELFIDDEYKTKKQIIFNLVDQDEEALGFVDKIIPKRQSLIFNCVQEDVMNLSRKVTYQEQLKSQDFIYSIGLCDYLPDRVLRQLIEFCLSVLSESGRLILAHKDITRCNPMAPDWFCDWKFYPRTEEEFKRLIQSAKDKKMTFEKTVREKSGRIFFITTRK